MSAAELPHGRIAVYCDHLGCSASVKGTRMSLGEVRDLALSRGWLHRSPPWREWCPEHWPASARSRKAPR